MIHTQSIEEFLKDLASAKPTPGGGSAAAVSGAMGAALISMVANLTIGKKGYESVEDEMKSQLQAAENLRQRFVELISEDIASFNRLMDAYKLPKNTEEEKDIRSAAIQSGLKLATNSPLDIAKACLQGIQLAERSARFGNKMVISDAGVAVVLLESALKSAALNVYINVPSIKDQTFKDIAVNNLEELSKTGEGLTATVFAQVKNTLNS